MKKFCVRCGSEEGDTIYIVDGLCPRCFIEVNKPSIESIKIRYCGKCGAIYCSGKWVAAAESSPADTAKEIILKYLKFSKKIRVADISINLNPYEDTNGKAKIVFDIENKFKFQYELPIQIRWSRATCPSCLRKAGGGYSSIIQIRYVNWGDEIARFVEEVLNVYREYIIDIDEVKNGYNIKLADPHIAKRIADLTRRRWRNTKILESYGDSKKLRDGSRFSRLYISIRILNFKRGDYVVLNGKPYRVVDIDEKGVVISDQDGALHRIDMDELVLKYMKSRIKHSI
ncbi:MAG: 60S ribosomal export protein NMD3 [Ignisphaera sp.]|nr:60S ribosomal export protein NMD3 [Ignisphaera sp.]MCX8168342.1 60S ribosomal export protein NMD3 [Ignisphaera sp.]MDW8085325.1 NMD3-related protein [Ignisphaera sp.]